MQSSIVDTKSIDAFRDKISTVDKSGNRVWLYPKNPKGPWTRFRTYIAWILLGILIAGPFMKINGEPVLLLNILERKFIIFGNIFWPQDFHIFLFVTIAFMIFIVVFTIVFGRIFCGFICPQTIFLEFVFRKIEFLIEGDYKTRMNLDKQGWTAEKIFKKTLKHSAYVIVSLIICHTFLAYIIGISELHDMLLAGPEKSTAGFISMFVFTGVFYWIFSRFREQVCTVVCPYGRLQGVLLDKNSLIVAYDYIRGETRAKFRKNENRIEEKKGDCIDCNQCVNVCPSGIDIRNGTQMECINCTACIDACDYMMENVGLPKGLIRFDSEEGIAEKKPFRFTPRIIGYSVVLFLLLGIIVFLLTFRNDIETSMLRTPGMMYQEMPDGRISNLYNVKVINKTGKEIDIKLKVESEFGEIKPVTEKITVPAFGSGETAAFIILDRKDIDHPKMNIIIGVYGDEGKLETLNTKFLGPI